MKTISDINALIPELTDLLYKADHEIGDSSKGASNTIVYDKDGWFIEIGYRCYGRWDVFRGDYFTPSSCELESFWIEVTDIYATHEDSAGLTEFDEDELGELWDALEKVIG